MSNVMLLGKRHPRPGVEKENPRGRKRVKCVCVFGIRYCAQARCITSQCPTQHRAYKYIYHAYVGKCIPQWSTPPF
jgi:hypothetical protein